MNAKELKAVLQALQEHEVSELNLETADYKISIKRGPDTQYAVAPSAVSAPAPAQVQVPQVPAPVPTAPATPTPAPAATPKEDTSKYLEVKAPIVGTFYAAASPEAAPYAKVGDKVQKGQVLCIIEAMKLMNEIESDHAGTVRKINMNNAEPVEYGQVLFLIEPV
jgi:acetyl-CoA carboxylase biotin carboxyl carrier protein